jgi:hypothetical protein
MTTNRLGIVRWIAGAMLCGPLMGCGYTMDRPFRKDIQSVHVPIFQSKEFRRNLEFQLTEALQKRIQLDTPYRIADKKHADTELTGEILEVRQATFGNDFNTGLPRETAATFVIAFRWKDLRSGEMLLERPRFIETVTYIRPVGERFFEGSERAVNRLAERIVEEMEDNW